MALLLSASSAAWSTQIGATASSLNGTIIVEN